MVALLSLLITRIATIPLTATGMPRPSAVPGPLGAEWRRLHHHKVGRSSAEPSPVPPKPVYASAALLHISGEYEVKEAAPWALGLRGEGLLVLGIVRNGGTYLGVPHQAQAYRPGETIILYGRDGRFAVLTAHEQAVADQHAVADRQFGTAV